MSYEYDNPNGWRSPRSSVPSRDDRPTRQAREPEFVMPGPRTLPPWCESCRCQHPPGQHAQVPWCRICHKQHRPNEAHLGDSSDWAREDGGPGPHESIALVSVERGPQPKRKVNEMTWLRDDRSVNSEPYDPVAPIPQETQRNGHPE